MQNFVTKVTEVRHSVFWSFLGLILLIECFIHCVAKQIEPPQKVNKRTAVSQ